MQPFFRFLIRSGAATFCLSHLSFLCSVCAFRNVWSISAEVLLTGYWSFLFHPQMLCKVAVGPCHCTWSSLGGFAVPCTWSPMPILNRRILSLAVVLVLVIRFRCLRCCLVIHLPSCLSEGCFFFIVFFCSYRWVTPILQLTMRVAFVFSSSVYIFPENMQTSDGSF